MTLTDIGVPLIKEVLPKLATKVTSILDKFERKSSGQGAIAKSRVEAIISEIRIHFIYLE